MSKKQISASDRPRWQAYGYFDGTDALADPDALAILRWRMANAKPSALRFNPLNAQRTLWKPAVAWVADAVDWPEFWPQLSQANPELWPIESQPPVPTRAYAYDAQQRRITDREPTIDRTQWVQNYDHYQYDQKG
jgi:hypothetical protein